jgi:hypothetical protein
MNAPEVLMLLTVIGTFPVLLSVRYWSAKLPVATMPKSMLLGDSVAAAKFPVPVKGASITFCGVVALR